MDKCDRCVMCAAETEYKISTPVFARKYYIEGAGQLCSSCYFDIYGANLRNYDLPEYC